MARQFTRGYIGLQTHGGTDRISYREIEVKDFTPADIPVNTVAPTVTGTGFTGQAADLQPRHVDHGRGHDVLRHVVPLEQDPADATRASARRAQIDYWQLHHAGRARATATQALTWTDSQIVGEGDTYTPAADDVGKVVYCAVNADNGGATVWKTASAPEILTATNADTTPAAPSRRTLEPDARHAGRRSARSRPGVDARLRRRDDGQRDLHRRATRRSRVSDPGHLINGAFSLPEALRVEIAPAVLDGPVSNDPVAITFRQHIGATDALRTGTYSKTLTFTLSTTTP